MAYVYQVHSSPKKNRFGFLNGLSVNTWIVLVNVFAFVLFTAFLSFNILSVDDIAIKPANIFSGNYLWTFLTSMFMHGGFFHLFANMLSLLFLGSFVEKLIGKKRYFWFYIFSGLFAGLFFVLVSWIMSVYFGFSGDFNTYAVGASGALFGLVGFLMLITPNLSVYLFFIPIPIKMKYAAPGILLLLWLISIAGNVPIGNTAHLGGFIAGIGYGLYIKSKYKRKSVAISKHFS